MVEPTSVRLERELIEKVKEDAKREGRSTSKQIEYMLKQYYDLKRLLTNN
jgi:hypothetical protein